MCRRLTTATRLMRPICQGCIAAGDSQDSQVEVEELIREAIIMHLESLREHGDPVPEPQTSVALVEV